MSEENAILEMKNITMNFDGVKALKQVDFSLKRGEIHGLVGKNGAGKSTLIKILMGIHTPEEGDILIDGRQLSRDESVRNREEYVSAIFQEFSLIPDLSVKKNVFFAAEPRIGPFVDDKECFRRTNAFFQEFGIEIDPDSLVRELTTAEMQLVEVAKAILKNKRILIMDEPTAALEHGQKSRLFELMKKLKDSQVSIVFISHYLDDVMNICDSLSVLRDGQMVFSSSVPETTIDEVVDEIVGDEKVDLLHKRGEYFADYSRPLVRATVGSDGKEADRTIVAYRGEVVGLAGLKGSGTEEIVESIYGSAKGLQSQVEIDARHISNRSPADAIRNGITLVPGNRQTQGVFLTQSIVFNITLAVLRLLRRLLFVDDRAVQSTTSDLIGRLQIKTDDPSLPAKSLSGGNQQKVVIAKALTSKPRVLLMDDPTFGVDVHAKSEIMKITTDFVRSGNAVILVSSDYEELLQNCDRILVVKGRRVVREFKDVGSSQLTLSELTKAIEA